MSYTGNGNEDARITVAMNSFGNDLCGVSGSMGTAIGPTYINNSTASEIKQRMYEEYMRQQTINQLNGFVNPMPVMTTRPKSILEAVMENGQQAKANIKPTSLRVVFEVEQIDNGFLVTAWDGNSNTGGNMANSLFRTFIADTNEMGEVVAKSAVFAKLGK